MQNHGKGHWQAAKRILKYLKGTKDEGLCYTSRNLKFESNWELTLWCDASYAGCIDTRRSRGGYLIYLNDNLVAFNSSLQKCMALGTCDAEYMALSMGLKELTWVRMLLECMGLKVKLPMVVFEDNQAAKSIAENPESSKRTKHIDIRFHHVREQSEAGNIGIQYVATEKQKADGMTKDLARVPFQAFKSHVVDNTKTFFF